jgi:hypothetical protein
VWSNYILEVSVISIVLCPFFFIIPYLISRSKLKKAFENNPSPRGKRIFKPFAIGIDIDDESGSVFIRSESIKYTGRAGNFIYINLFDGSYYLLPLRSFSSVAEANHFLALVRNGISNERIEPITRFKSQYFLGLLCLIPFIGFIAGVVIIYRAFFILKDVLFALIGFTGIIITICFIYYLANSPENKKVFADISQTEINDLVKSIEFYKLQNGSYPDSLQQVIDKNSLISIYDISQDAKTGGHLPMYQYKKLGNKYLLFSPGLDGKPNTKDDIYPTLTNPDTSKLGFIKKN